MCGILSLVVLGFFGFFGVFGISSGAQEPLIAPTAVIVPTLLPTPTAFEPTQVPTMTPTPTPAAQSGDPVLVPTESYLIACDPIPAELDRAVVDGYKADVLNAETGWSYQPSEGEQKTIGTWWNDSTGAVAYAELLHYDCGLPPKVVDGYFNPDTWGLLFQNYQSYRLATTCASGDLRLFVFETVFNDRDYETRYWFEPVEDRRLMMFMLTTRVSEAAQTGPLTEALFPDLPNCARVVG
ncbi:MAG: hypothetical protein JNL42_06410 [Anaerolineae bacterium]|nr:hypothetical protein [Anaerolineae bacterium]